MGYRANGFLNLLNLHRSPLLSHGAARENPGFCPLTRLIGHKGVLGFDLAMPLVLWHQQKPKTEAPALPTTISAPTTPSRDDVRIQILIIFARLIRLHNNHLKDLGNVPIP